MILSLWIIDHLLKLVIILYHICYKWLPLITHLTSYPALATVEYKLSVIILVANNLVYLLPFMITSVNIDPLYPIKIRGLSFDDLYVLPDAVRLECHVYKFAHFPILVFNMLCDGIRVPYLKIHFYEVPAYQGHLLVFLIEILTFFFNMFVKENNSPDLVQDLIENWNYHYVIS